MRAFGEVGRKIVRRGRFEEGPGEADGEPVGGLTGPGRDPVADRRGLRLRRSEDRGAAPDQQDGEDGPEGDPADRAQRGAERPGLHLLPSP